MANKPICFINLHASSGSNVTLGCKVSERSNGCSWKRRYNAISISGRYSYLDNSRKEPRHDCSIAIREIKDFDNGNWTCEEMAGDTSVTSDGQSIIQPCKMTLQNKQDQINSHTPNILSSSPQHYSSTTPTLLPTELTTKWNNSQALDTNVPAIVKTGLLTFAGLIGVFGLAVLIACVVAVIKFFLDSCRRPNTEQKSPENQGSEMERNESARRLLSNSSGASIEPMTDDSAENLYDDVAHRQPRKKRHRREHRERLPGQTHHNHHHHGYRRRHRRRNYTKMILDSIRASLPASVAAAALANFPPTPKLPKNINKRTVMETNCSFVNEVTIENHKVKQGHTKPSGNDGSSTSKIQTTLANSSVMFDHTSKSRMEARLNASYDVNSSRRMDGPLVGRRFNSTTQLSKQTTPQMKPKFPSPVLHHPKTITIKPMSSQAQSNLPSTKRIIPRRQETGGQSTSLTRTPPSLPKYKPKDQKDSMAKWKDDEQYEEIESNLSENVYHEVDQVLTQHKMMAEDLYENTFDVTHYENFDHSGNISPTVIVYGNARHDTTSSSQEETPNSQPTNPAKKKKPLPLQRTNITKTKTLIVEPTKV